MDTSFDYQAISLKPEKAGTYSANFININWRFSIICTSFFKFLWNGLMMAVMAESSSHEYNKYIVVLDWVHV